MCRLGCIAAQASIVYFTLRGSRLLSRTVFESSTASLLMCRVGAVEIVAVVGIGRASRREVQIGNTLTTVARGTSHANLERLGIDACTRDVTLTGLP